MRLNRLKTIIIILSSILFCLVLNCSYVYAADSSFWVEYMDVGQGDVEADVEKALISEWDMYHVSVVVHNSNIYHVLQLIFM